MSKKSHRTKKPKQAAGRAPQRPRQRSAKQTAIEAVNRIDEGIWTADGEEKPFWETKRLNEMSAPEWESLCDGCGQCCLIKIEDEDTTDLYLTRLTCSLLDVGCCRCKDYENRHTVMSDCVALDPKNVETIAWLPESCAYRRVAEGRGLAWWHPLISGDPDTVHQAGVSVRGWALPEDRARSPYIQHYIIGEIG